MNTQQVIGARIRALREGKGLTRAALGLRIDANPMTIYRWERGGAAAREDFLFRLLKELGVTIGQLYKGL